MKQTLLQIRLTDARVVLIQQYRNSVRADSQLNSESQACRWHVRRLKAALRTIKSIDRYLKKYE